ncbi:MAG TPA: glycosyltransferase family 2 protein [Lactovum miscens]|uniref:glycosyltransferase family 2 protein n=1 Tax=Lactovum miscens TaxID=190387 RepID=UPI002EDA5456
MSKKNFNNILYLVAFITTLIYLGWRIFYTIPWHDSIFSWVFGLVLWISELLSSFTAFILIINKKKKFSLEKPKVSESEYPEIDILIATHNEDLSILYKTVNACKHLTYPDSSKVHIFICDDTNRPEIRQLAEQFEVGYFGLENNKHAKSGNLNYAVSKTHSPYLATFDADMIPYDNFLLETIPYFLNESISGKPIGLIQTPQSFYNADIFQYHLFSESALPNEQDFFSKSVNVLNNTRGAAVYTGSNTMLRRQAIIDAGGFPTNTITEDFELGVRMNIAGYNNYSTTEPMASGLTPTSLRSVIKQRVRWGRGVIKSSYNTNIFFNPKLSFGQRMVYVNGYFYWSSFFRRLLYIIAPILFTVFHIRIVVANIWLLLFLWLPSYVLTSRSMSDVTDNFRTQRWGEIVETVFAPYLVIPLLLEAIGIKEKKFKVTSKDKEDIAWDYKFAFPYIILFILSIYGLVEFNLGKFGMALFYGSVISFWLINNIINLSFAILVTIGRPIYRKDERFFIKDDAFVEVNNNWHKVILNDISENGFSFISSDPLFLKDSFSIKFIDQGNENIIDGELVRVISRGDNWLYGAKIIVQSDEQQRKFFHYIYNRPNNYLSRRRDNWVTIIDDLTENIIRRIEFKKNDIINKFQKILKYPELITNYSIKIEDNFYKLIFFSIDHIIVRYEHSQPHKNRITINISETQLELLEESRNFIEKEISYRLLNLDDLSSIEIQKLYDIVNGGRK